MAVKQKGAGVETFSLEHTVIAAILAQGDTEGACASLNAFEQVPPEFFRTPVCARVYDAARRRAQRGEPWSEVSVIDDVGQEAVSEIWDLGAERDPEVTIREGVTAICDREYRGSCRRILENFATSHDPVEVVADLEQVQRIRPFAKDRSLAEEFLDHIAKCLNHGSFLQTGIRSLDNWFSGFMGGELVIVGARPGTGKSALMLQIALNMMEAGKRFVFVTLEMSRGSMCTRMGSSYVGTNITRPMIQEHQDKAAEFAGVLAKSNCEFATTTRTVAQIAASVRRAGKVDAVFVDYLQLLQDPAYQKQGRVQEVSAISRDLKLLAMDLDVPVICACQLNRLAEQRNDKKPKLSDLRESGSIEQDADQVILLHDPSRSVVPGQPHPGNRLQLIVAKNRRGAVGEMNLQYDKDAQRISSFEYRLG